MGTMMRSILALLISAAPALAAGAQEGKGSGLLLVLFLGFGALIIVFQLIPGLVLFVSMIKALFSESPGNVADALPGKRGDK